MTRYRRRVVATLAMPYPLGIVRTGGEDCLVTATEDHGPLLISRPPYHEAAELAPGPGGCMMIVQRAEDRGGEGGAFHAIMGCFVGYKFQSGGIDRLEPPPAPGAGWAATRILDVPFAHRFAFVERAGTPYLLAASIAHDKKDPGDWSQPGSVYAAKVPRAGNAGWSMTPVLEGVHRNHGLLVAPLRGVPSVLVSGAEGIFAASLRGTGSDWGFERILDSEVSEFGLLDLDGDGTDELVTIEPFHGSTMRIYRDASGRWSQSWEGNLDFGHCLIAQVVNGAPSVLVSNRAGSRDLLLLQWPHSPGSLRDPVTTVIEAGAGSANMLVHRFNGRDLVFATNQVRGEIVMYEPSP